MSAICLGTAALLAVLLPPMRPSATQSAPATAAPAQQDLQAASAAEAALTGGA